VIVSLVGVHEHVVVARQDGSLVADVRPLVRMNVSVIVEQNGQREQGSMGGGGRSDYNFS
jgi:Predicted Zn-dependent proteases and their inactivated homologs